MTRLSDRARACWENASDFRITGRVNEVVGLIVESIGPPGVSIGELCHIEKPDGERIPAEVVGFEDNIVQIMPIGDVQGISSDSQVIAAGHPFRMKVGEHLLGRVIDGRGDPMDTGPPLTQGKPMSIYRDSPSSLHRQRITEPLATGIRAIDGCLTLGRGQRVGIFSGSGVGKSTLMGMIARSTDADVNVIALIGERNREVREFIDKNLQGARENSVIVAATSDQPPLVRKRASYIATTIAEYFRDQGQDVLLMMDSVTRVARAQREIGLAAGEPPATRGYPPSVFNFLPQLLERAGAGEEGTITGIYNVLVEGDDFNEPISDTVRGILDGHISLNRELASRNHYPAIDVLESVSRVMEDITEENHRQASGKLKEVMATYRDAEDLINIGAYESGSNPEIDHALDHIDDVRDFLQQDIYEEADYEETVDQLKSIFEDSSPSLDAEGMTQIG
ncbi:MAG: FliI/YscN family ATPase [bacterium]